MVISAPLLTNVLDLLAFMLVTPDIVGVARLHRGFAAAYDACRWLFHHHGRPSFATPFSFLYYGMAAGIMVMALVLPAVYSSVLAYICFAFIQFLILFGGMMLLIDRAARWIRLERILLLAGASVFILARLISIHHEYVAAN